MLSVIVKALSSVSVTVMVCLPFFFRIVSLTKVYTPASAVVKVKFAGKVAVLSELVKWTVPT